MAFKSKILAAGLAAIIAGFGIFAANINTAQAQTDNDNANSAIAQMVQMIESLKQQIQQIIALIAQLKPQETCGNSKCRFGETAATCPADCGTTTNDNGKAKCSATGGVWKYSDCASGCVYNTKSERAVGGKSCAAVCIKDFTCECAGGKYWASREEGCINNTADTCGNGICDLEESVANCPADCNDCVIGFKANECCGCPKKISRSLVGTNGWVAYEKGKDYSAFPKKENCAGIACSPCEDINTIYQNNCALCGNGTCEIGETADNCTKDCAGESGKITVVCAPGGDCRTRICYIEGEGEIGMTAGPGKPCCSGLTAQARITTYPNGTQTVTEGFVCRKPVAASCKKEGELFGYLEGECCEGLLKVYPDGAKTYSAGESQNFQVTCKKPASYITNAPAKCVAVNIKALANNKYVAAENGGASPLIANHDTAGPWELFYILPAADGSINIKAGFNGKYVTAENGGASPLIANRDTAGPWEKFVLAPIFNTNEVAIMASINNRYVTAENGGAQALVANRDEIGPWEKFTITKVSDCQIQ